MKQEIEITQYDAKKGIFKYYKTYKQHFHT